jgi:hypothetical protein
MLEDISGPFDTRSGVVRAQISGLSQFRIPGPVQIPAVQLSGFADGSVRFASGNNEDSRQQTLISRINGGSFFAQLNPADATHANVLGGTFSIGDVNGDGVNGILIGVIRQADPAAGGRPTLDGLVIATYGEGILSCQGGTGDVTINWGNQNLNGPFQSEFRLLAAVQKKARQ